MGDNKTKSESILVDIPDLSQWTKIPDFSTIPETYIYRAPPEFLIKYWLDYCALFKKWVAIMKKNWLRGFIKDDWDILIEGITELKERFKYDTSVFGKDDKYWWIKSNWDIIAYWFIKCEDFQCWDDISYTTLWYWLFRNGDGKSWLCKYDGTIIWGWFSRIDCFVEWFSVFSREDWSKGWIRHDWVILIESKNYKECNRFSNGFGRFENQDWTNWWVKSDWTILVDWLIYGWRFKWWYATFETLNKKQWLIGSDGKIVVDNFDKLGELYWWYRNFEKDWKQWWIKNSWEQLAYWFDYCWELKEWNAFFKIWKLEWRSSLVFINNLAVFEYKDEKLKKILSWWIKSNGTILAKWFDRVIDFDKDFKMAKLKKLDITSWNISMWYINTKWTILYAKNIYLFDEEFEGYSKFEREDSTVWFLDTKFRQWDDIQNRNNTIYLKKNWKWFIEGLIEKANS